MRCRRSGIRARRGTKGVRTVGEKPGSGLSPEQRIRGAQPQDGRNCAAGCYRPGRRCTKQAPQSDSLGLEALRAFVASRTAICSKYVAMWEGGGGGGVHCLGSECGETFLPAIKRVETRALAYLGQARQYSGHRSLVGTTVTAAGAVAQQSWVLMAPIIF